VKLAFVDTETIRLQPGRHVVWEIGVLVYDTETDFIEDFETYQAVPDLALAEPIALKVGGYRERIANDLAGAPAGTCFQKGRGLIDRRMVLAGLRGLLAGRIIAGSKPSFDMEHLAVFFDGEPPSWHHHPIDIPSMILGRLVHTGLPPMWGSHQLSTAIGVYPASYGRHTAFGDCQWALAQWRRLVGM
jgi:hypothetical protein